MRFAVPRRAVRYDVRAEVLLLHSMLSPAAYEVLATEGVLRADPALVDNAFRDAYHWLMGQARRRVTGARGVCPIWFWARIRRRDLLLDIRHAARHEPGSVLITCRIPGARCLLSAYDDWHSVLDPGPLVPLPPGVTPDDGSAWAAWTARHDAAWEDLDRRLAEASLPRTAPFGSWPADVRADLERGWEHIFDLDGYSDGEYWQATVEEVHASDVVTAARPVPLPSLRRR
jgi:hypothetical protein